MLPVRRHGEVFVWFARFADEGHLDRHLKWVRECGRWRDQVRPVLAERLAGSPQRLRLAPTGRSALR
ncbi:hypothetical protein [Streptomyces griseus]|uniref:hypothetical protein n=1 Tax=Streptomyces griseus TaxID=1911 RepID=UPI0004C8DEEE|nr:hypothetical protein [Streptomyces griseus]